MKYALAAISTFLVLTSAAHAGGQYKLEVKAPASVKKGAREAAQIHVEGANGSHINTEFPAKLTIVAPTGVTVEKPSQTKEDAVTLRQEAAIFKIAFTSSEAGRKDFTGELRFAICSESSCNTSSETIAFSVDVK